MCPSQNPAGKGNLADEAADQYPCHHSVCGAHLLRDCLWVAEQEKQPWATLMHEVLRGMAKAAERWRAQGAKALPQAERDEWIAQYFSVLASGFAAHLAQAPPEGDPPPKKPGRQKQSGSKNLLDALLTRAEQVLAFLDDVSIPNTFNLAERDVRMSHPCSKRFLGPFAVRKGPRLFASFAVIFPRCANKGIPLSRPCSLFLLGNLFPSPGGSEPTTSSDTSPLRARERSRCAPRLTLCMLCHVTRRAARAYPTSGVPSIMPISTRQSSFPVSALRATSALSSSAPEVRCETTP